MLYLIVVNPELLLEIVNDIFVHLEGPGKDICIDRRSRSKHRVRDGDHSRILAAESGERNSRGVSRVELEVNQTDWEHKHFSRAENLCEEAVSVLVGRHETNQELPLNDDKDFRAARVDVRRVLAVWCVVNSNQWDPKSVEPWNFVDVHSGHIGADFVVSVSGFVEAGKEEILCLGKLWILAEFPINKYCLTKAKNKHL